MSSKFSPSQLVDAIVMDLADSVPELANEKPRLQKWIMMIQGRSGVADSVKLTPEQILDPVKRPPGRIYRDANGALNVVPGNVQQPKPADVEGPDVQMLVIEDMTERRVMGLAKYGKPVRPFNGRSALIDLYQELLDACVYIRQGIEEERWHGLKKLSPDCAMRAREVNDRG